MLNCATIGVAEFAVDSAPQGLAMNGNSLAKVDCLCQVRKARSKSKRLVAVLGSSIMTADEEYA
jgi:hypothetical protein